MCNGTIMIYSTTNKHKFREAEKVFEDIRMRGVDTEEIQGSPQRIIRDKCLKAYKVVEEPVVVDDVSFFIDDLGGFPGPYIKYFLQGLNAEEIGSVFEGSSAVASCLLGYTDNGETVTVCKGSVEGSIVQFTEGEFGFDPVFLPTGSKKTWGEMSTEEKSEKSHRAKALQELKKRI